MTDDRSQVGFALMEPAFLRVLADERPAAAWRPARNGPQATFNGWFSWAAARWSGLATGVAARSTRRRLPPGH